MVLQGLYEQQERAYQCRRTRLGEEDVDTLDSLGLLATVLSDQGKYEEAEVMHRQALALTEKVVGKEHPSTLTSMNNLAGVLIRQGKYKEAEQIHRQVLILGEKVLGRSI